MNVTMNTHATIQSAIVALEAQRGQIDQAIANLRAVLGSDEPIARAHTAVRAKNGRTDGARRAPGRPRTAVRSLPDQAIEDGGVLAALTKAGGSLRPSDLIKAVGRSEPTVRKAVKLLAKAGKVTLVGKVRTQLISLPGKPPKEAP